MDRVELLERVLRRHLGHRLLAEDVGSSYAGVMDDAFAVPLLFTRVGAKRLDLDVSGGLLLQVDPDTVSFDADFLYLLLRLRSDTFVEEMETSLLITFLQEITEFAKRIHHGVGGEKVMGVATEQLGRSRIRDIGSEAGKHRECVCG